MACKKANILSITNLSKPFYSNNSNTYCSYRYLIGSVYLLPLRGIRHLPPWQLIDQPTYPPDYHGGKYLGTWYLDRPANS